MLSIPSIYTIAFSSRTPIHIYQTTASNLQKQLHRDPTIVHNPCQAQPAKLFTKTIMHCLVNLALALLPLANAIPQYPGTVICDSTPVTEFSYDTKTKEEVTENYGDSGWVNHDAQTCNSNTEGQCYLAAHTHQGS